MSIRAFLFAIWLLGAQAGFSDTIVCRFVFSNRTVNNPVELYFPLKNGGDTERSFQTELSGSIVMGNFQIDVTVSDRLRVTVFNSVRVRSVWKSIEKLTYQKSSSLFEDAFNYQNNILTVNCSIKSDDAFEDHFNARFQAELNQSASQTVNQGIAK